MFLNENGLITNNQSGFRPGDSPPNQLLYFINEIHEAFEDPNSLEVRAVFLLTKSGTRVCSSSLNRME